MARSVAHNRGGEPESNSPKPLNFHVFKNSEGLSIEPLEDRGGGKGSDFSRRWVFGAAQTDRGQRRQSSLLQKTGISFDDDLPPSEAQPLAEQRERVRARRMAKLKNKSGICRNWPIIGW